MEIEEHPQKGGKKFEDDLLVRAGPEKSTVQGGPPSKCVLKRHAPWRHCTLIIFM